MVTYGPSLLCIEAGVGPMALETYVFGPNMMRGATHQ